MTAATDHPAAAPHGFVTKAIHWISLLMIGYGYMKGLDSVSELADPAVLRFEIVFTAILGALFAFRLFWTKKIGGATRLPQQAPWWEQIASRVVHAGLYVSVFGIVGTGFGIAYAYSTAALSGWFLDAMVGLHEASLAILPPLILIHVAGALWHKVVRRDGVLESMTGRLPQ